MFFTSQSEAALRSIGDYSVPVEQVPVQSAPFYK